MDKSINIGGNIFNISSDDNYLADMPDEFDTHMVQLFDSLANENCIVADVGANIGMTALLFSSRCKQVIAFEPSPSTFYILKRNIEQAKAHNVILENIGIGNTQETLKLVFSLQDRAGAFVSNHALEGYHHESIYIDTLDNALKKHSIYPDIIKIDVEGYEINVLKGGMNYILSSKPIVIMEMNHFCLNVLHRICLPNFLEYLCTIFPLLYAIDRDNSEIIEMHDNANRYKAMYGNAIMNRFPNLVGGFDESITEKLYTLGNDAKKIASMNSLPSHELNKVQGYITLNSIPEPVQKGQHFFVLAKIYNDSSIPWHCYGIHPIHLSYHWKDQIDNFIIFDGVRTKLDCKTILPNSSTAKKMIITPPPLEGNFKLIITLVQEGVAWFEDIGFCPLEIDITVL